MFFFSDELPVEYKLKRCGYLKANSSTYKNFIENNQNLFSVFSINIAESETDSSLKLVLFQ